MNLGFVTAFGWSVLGLIAYAALMLVGAAWSHVIREDRRLLPVFIFVHAVMFVFAVSLLVLPAEVP